MLRYAITDRRLAASSPGGEAESFAWHCARIARGGADFVLLREKDLPAGELLALGRGALAAVRGAGASTRVLLAGRLDVALALGADGVHLSAAPGELTPAQVRSLMPGAFVSVSCHTLAEVVRARDGGASAILFGPVFGKVVDGVEVVSGVGLDLLRQACAAAREVDVLALGGVTHGNAAACVEAGAAGVAAIRMFWSADAQQRYGRP